jgi:hypothetical protein
MGIYFGSRELQALSERQRTPSTEFGMHLIRKESMKQQEKVVQQVYNPNNLLDTLIKRMGLANDGALSRRLRVATKVISNIRHGTLPVGASMLMWINEATGISICELRELMGDRRARCRLSYPMPRPSRF